MNTTFDGDQRDPDTALRLDGVEKVFGSRHAVDGLNLRVQRGELLCLLGPNGAGKTTTIEMCEGFVKPTQGHISVLGLDPSREPDKVRSRIGIMLQGGGSYNGLKAEEMLQLTANYYRDPHDPAWLLDVLGLEGVRSTTYRRLSGGQKQRLSLALAVIGRPEMVFLDEPTAGLDAQSRLVVWELIRALKRDGVTVILTTHLMDEAQSLADRVHIIDHGRTVTEGSPGELMTQGANPLVVIETDKTVDSAAFQENTGAHIQASRPLYYRVQEVASPGLLAKATRELERQGVLAQRIDTVHRNLEDVFLELTGRNLRS